MMQKKLFGIVPAMITPLREDGSLDADSLEKLIEHMLAAGVHGIFAAGLTGEGSALEPPLLQELISRSAAIIRGRVPLCVGVLEAGTRKVIETAKFVEDAGADMLSTTVPRDGLTPSQNEIVVHFENITHATSLPWMVYGNAGAFTDIRPETMARLADLDGIQAIKDTRPDFEGCLKDIIAVRGKAVSLLCGGEYLVGPGLLFGADGNISGAANLFPELFVRLYHAAKTGDTETVRKVAEKIAAIHSMTAMPGVSWLAVFKYAGSRMGLMQPWCCRPHRALNPEERRCVDAAMDEFLS